MVVSFREVVGASLSSELHCVRAPSVETVKPVTDSAAGRALSARAFRRRNFFLARTAYLTTSVTLFFFNGRSERQVPHFATKTPVDPRNPIDVGKYMCKL